MKIQKLKENGDLTNKLINEFGKPYSLDQKLKIKKYGLGGLIYRSSNSQISEFHDRYSNKVKTHVEPTYEGLIFRLWTSKTMNAYGIRYDQIKIIKLLKHEDLVNPHIGSLMWLTLKINLPLKYARYLGRIGEYECGPIDLNIQCHDGSFVEYEINGFAWDQVKSFFNQDSMIKKVNVENENTAGNKTQPQASAENQFDSFMP